MHNVFLPPNRENGRICCSYALGTQAVNSDLLVWSSELVFSWSKRFDTDRKNSKYFSRTSRWKIDGIRQDFRESRSHFFLISARKFTSRCLCLDIFDAIRQHKVYTRKLKPLAHLVSPYWGRIHSTIIICFSVIDFHDGSIHNEVLSCRNRKKVGMTNFINFSSTRSRKIRNIFSIGQKFIKS